MPASRTTRFPLLIAAAFILVLLAACAQSTPLPTSAPSSTPVPATDVLAATSTPLPSNTPTRTLTPTVTATLPPTATFTATPDPALAQVKLIGLSWLEKSPYNLLLAFAFPGPVDPNAYRVTLEDKEYRCEVLAQYPNRLYCNGQGAKVLAQATVRVYPAGSDLSGYEIKVWVPFFR